MGEPSSLGAGALRALATRHGIRPKRSLGQHFLVDPNLARAIAADARVGSGDRVVEIGAGLGSLTRALAETGAEVLAIEVDARLIPALEEAVADLRHVRVLQADAMAFGWLDLIDRDGWVLSGNLPYNVATPLVLGTLERAPEVRRLVVMVQRDMGERFVAAPGDPAHGVTSLRTAYRAEAAIVRRVPASVFWPRPQVESVVVSLDRRDRPPVAVDEAELWRIVDAGFAEKRKTIRNALRRLGHPPDVADGALRACGIPPAARAETLSLADFACLAERAP